LFYCIIVLLPYSINYQGIRACAIVQVITITTTAPNAIAKNIKEVHMTINFGVRSAKETSAQRII